MPNRPYRMTIDLNVLNHYRAIDRHAAQRLRQWLCRKHKVRSGKLVRFPDQRLFNDMGLTRLAPRTGSLPWAKA